MKVAVTGWGAVSPAGWSAPALLGALEGDMALPATEVVARGDDSRGFPGRPVPQPGETPGAPDLRHPRLRRASRITRFGVAAALEALGPERRAGVADGRFRLGVVSVVMDACVGYSGRFFAEVLDDPKLASPILFPETVFNAPASHLAAVLGATGLNDTLVGGPAHFVAGLAYAAAWLADGRADGVVVVGAEEVDWLTAEAVDLFGHGLVTAEGAGALYLEPADDRGPEIELEVATDVLSGHACGDGAAPGAAAGPPEQVRALVGGEGGGDGPATVARALFDSDWSGRQDAVDSPESAERRAWDGCGATVKYSPREVLGESLGARSAWQCAAAAEWLHRQQAPAKAWVAALGNHGQAAGVRMGTAGPAGSAEREAP